MSATKKERNTKKQHDGIVLQIFLQLLGILLKLCDYMVVSVLCNTGKEQLRNGVLTSIDIASMFLFNSPCRTKVKPVNISPFRNSDILTVNTLRQPAHFCLYITIEHDGLWSVLKHELIFMADYWVKNKRGACHSGFLKHLFCSAILKTCITGNYL